MNHHVKLTFKGRDYSKPISKYKTQFQSIYLGTTILEKILIQASFTSSGLSDISFSNIVNRFINTLFTTSVVLFFISLTSFFAPISDKIATNCSPLLSVKVSLNEESNFPLFFLRL